MTITLAAELLPKFPRGQKVASESVGFHHEAQFGLERKKKCTKMLVITMSYIAQENRDHFVFLKNGPSSPHVRKKQRAEQSRHKKTTAVRKETELLCGPRKIYPFFFLSKICFRFSLKRNIRCERRN